MKKKFIRKNKQQNIRAVVVGTSAGGMKALGELVSELPARFSLPLIVVQHVHPESEGFLPQFLAQTARLPAKEAEENEPIRPGNIYTAPAGYHLLIEETETFSLSIDEPVHFARPSIDVLFESAADTYGPALAGVILTGANRDGAWGLRRIKEKGGLVFIQEPETAEAGEMPVGALEELRNLGADCILPPSGIGEALINLWDPVR